MPQAVIMDLDSTLLDAYSKQEGRAFNFHYQSNGYHPFVCYDGMTGDLIKIQLRDGTQYSCTGVVDFLQPIQDIPLGNYILKYCMTIVRHFQLSVEKTCSYFIALHLFKIIGNN